MNNPLVEMAAVRASFMQQLAGRHPRLRSNPEAPDLAFMVGILSLLESIYAISIEETLEALNLEAEVRDALLSREGDYGRILDLVESMERSYFGVTPEKLEILGLSQEDLLSSQIVAFKWLGETF
jgi:EAL and modified HD-GYP domain-containing signal transduction protein